LTESTKNINKNKSKDHPRKQVHGRHKVVAGEIAKEADASGKALVKGPRMVRDLEQAVQLETRSLGGDPRKVPGSAEVGRVARDLVEREEGVCVAADAMTEPL